MKLFAKILIFAFVVIGCAREHIPFEVDSSLVRIGINFSPNFANQTTNLTRTGGNQIATDLELEMKNTTLFVFSHPNYDASNSSGYVTPTPDGKLLTYATLTQHTTGNIPAGVIDEYVCYVSEIKAPVVAIGIANLPQDVLNSMLQRIDDGEHITYSQFVSESVLEIAATEGNVTVDANNVILKNGSDGILPLSVDPIELPELTQATIDYADTHKPEASNSTFAYARIDVLLDTQNSTLIDEVALKSAWLCNIPIVPNYTGVVDLITYLDYGAEVTTETNRNTEEQPNAEGSNDIIQGLYMYPNTIVENVSDENKVYVIVKAQTSESIGDEYYKIEIRYDKDNATSYSIERNTRYRLLIKDFEGNGYASFDEALISPPSNVKFEIEIDSSTGNDFLVTNGTSYMALSNTIVDVFGSGEQLYGRNLTAFTVFYKENSSVEATAGASKLPINLTKSISTISQGLHLPDSLEFKNNFTQDTIFPIRFRVDSSFSGYGEIIVRVGNLVGKVKINLIELEPQQTTIDRYTTPGYTYAYLEVEGLQPADIATWIRFGNTSDIEYAAQDGQGIPISLPLLTTGYRDNFICPAIIYNENGESARTYILQENLEIIDFTDREVVNSYIGGSYNIAGKEKADLTLSNCYILNPNPNQARKYYIPITKRITDIWQGYTTSEEKTKYRNRTVKLFDESNNFTLPKGWKVKVLWWDSQRIYDGNLEFVRDSTDYDNNSISVIIPARMENYGVVSVAVTDGSGSEELVGGRGDGGTEDVILWSWTFWITDYDPTSIARVSSPTNGAGSYTAGGAYTPSGTMTYTDAVHRYSNGTWVNSTASNYNNGTYGVNSTGYNARRFIMDRNFGAFANTYTGHGTIYNSTFIKVISPPVSGICSVQHGNPRPIPGAGTLDSKGRAIDFIEKDDGYKTVVELAQYPYHFCNGVPKFSSWQQPFVADDTDNIWARSGDTNYLYCYNIWADKDLRTDEDLLARVKKSIFDPSPLGWMVSSKNTFYNFTTANTPYNNTTTPEASTGSVYNNFANLFYIPYRSSGTGQYVLAKSDIFVDLYIRSNESLATAYSESPTGAEGFRDDISFNIYAVGGGTSTASYRVYAASGTGKASGLAIRPVTEAEY